MCGPRSLECYSTAREINAILLEKLVLTKIFLSLVKVVRENEEAFNDLPPNEFCFHKTHLLC